LRVVGRRWLEPLMLGVLLKVVEVVEVVEAHEVGLRNGKWKK